MKIKQVCALTGLTPRAVRFYTEKGLLPPGEEKAYGRTLRDYTAEDVRTLQDIVTLRENGFTVQEILSMQQDAKTVAPLVQARMAALREELDAGHTTLYLLEAESEHPGDWRALARNLRPTGAATGAEPDFSGLYDEEEWVLQQEEAPPPRNRALRICCILAAVVLAVLIIAEPLRDALQRLEPVSIIFSESEIKFTKLNHNEVFLTHDRDSAYPPLTELFNMERKIAVDGVDTSALFPDTTYCCVLLRVEMPRWRAQQMGLLDDRGIITLNNIRSFDQVKGYITLVDVHAG